MSQMEMEKNSPLRDVMNSTMEKVREMVDANNIVGAPITTPDGVTLIPISRVSFGFGSGGGDYGKQGLRRWRRRRCEDRPGGLSGHQGRNHAGDAGGGAACIYGGPHCGYGTGYCRQNRKIFR